MTLFSPLKRRRHRPLTGSVQRRRAAMRQGETLREIERLFGAAASSGQERGQPPVSVRGNGNIVITAPVTVGALSESQLAELLARLAVPPL